MPLSAPDAIALAERQTRALADFDAPLLLFLDRIGDFRIDVETPDGPAYRRRLTRSQRSLGDVPGTTGCRLYEVGVGQDLRFLVVQREVDKALVREAPVWGPRVAGREILVDEGRGGCEANRRAARVDGG